jgi:hypothetical protein
VLEFVREIYSGLCIGFLCWSLYGFSPEFVFEFVGLDFLCKFFVRQFFVLGFVRGNSRSLYGIF